MTKPMHYALTQTAAPADEPILIDEARAHLRAPDEEDDALIASLITAARQHTELVTSCLLVTQTWKMNLDCFPSYCQRDDWGTIKIPVRPVQSIMTIKYIDADGTQQTLNSALYQLDKDSFLARIRPVYNQTWPSIRHQMNAVEVIFVGGYGATPAAVPENLKAGIKLLLGHLYENREQSVVGVPIQTIPMGYEALVGTEKVYRV